jgi:DNA-binding transcriptional MerR regulator
MSINAPPKSTRETWRDWQPEGFPEPTVLYTRDELAHRLQSRGIDVSAGDLRYWESAGILPRTVRQWHKGATRSTYPEWFGYLARRVRQLQSEGYTLQQIRPRIRRNAELLLRSPDGDDRDAIRSELRFYEYAVGPEDLDFPDELSPALVKLARLHEGVTGIAVDHIEVGVVDIDGRGTTYRIPQRPTERLTY